MSNKSSQPQTTSQRPQPHKNVATYALITLPIAWIICDIYAFYMGETVVGGICTAVTVAIIIFAIALKMRERKINRQAMEAYENEHSSQSQ